LCDNTIHLLPWLFVEGVSAIGFSTAVLVAPTGPAIDLYPASHCTLEYQRTVKSFFPLPRTLRRPLPTLPSLSDALAFLSATAVTPLVQLTPHVGLPTIFVKDEGTSLGQQSFKALGVSYALHQISAGHGTHGHAICGSRALVSQTDGNHGAALAFFAQTRNLPCHIFVPKNMTQERIDKLVDLKAVVHRPDATYDECAIIMVKEARVNNWLIISDQSFLPSLLFPNGYTLLFLESVDQMKTMKTHVLVQMGVGGLLRAVIIFFSTYVGRAKRAYLIDELSLLTCAHSGPHQLPRAKRAYLKDQFGSALTLYSLSPCSSPTQVRALARKQYSHQDHRGRAGRRRTCRLAASTRSISSPARVAPTPSLRA